jgi:hypothetical protein
MVFDYLALFVIGLFLDRDPQNKQCLDTSHHRRVRKGKGLAI